jgi:hypothetical protein
VSGLNAEFRRKEASMVERYHGDLFLYWAQGRSIVLLTLLGINFLILGIALAGLVSALRTREVAKKKSAG